MSNKSKQERDR